MTAITPAVSLISDNTFDKRDFFVKTAIFDGATAFFRSFDALQHPFAYSTVDVNHRDFGAFAPTQSGFDSLLAFTGNLVIEYAFLRIQQVRLNSKFVRLIS